MRQAVRQKSTNGSTTRLPTSKAGFIPSPTKGWYVGANLSAAPKGTAYILDNAFPQQDYVRMRGGSLAYATGMPNAAVNTLIPYINGLSSKFFAGCSGSIYDVSSSGVVGAAAVSGLNSSAYLEYTQFTNSGATWLMVVNGVDAAQLYNGTSWTTTPAITGLSGGNLAFVWPFRNRIYGVQAASLTYWYLGLNSIGGAATSVDMSGVFKYGGYLLCGTSWSISSSSGLYEVLVLITSEGEVAIYDGLNPADTVWTIKGLYKISKPLGRRCILKAGGDLAIMTEDGIIPMSSAMTLDQIALQNVAVTKPIAPAWRDAVVARQGLVGWQIVTWPLQSMGIINLPKTSTGDATQYVANVRTGAWARYLGWDANCFAVYNNALYYGTSDGRVMQAETGGQDDGKNYTWTVFPSYSDLGSPALTKHVKMVKARIQSAYAVTPQITVKVDFDTTKPAQPTASFSNAGGALWDSAIWDAAIWPAALTDLSNWTDAEGFGAMVSPVIQLTLSTTATPDVRLTAIELLYENGNPLG
ncbi:hypothetical protein JEY40_24650 [Bradyrhizobium japonicum]|uniref:hypothetical protein n=1 Tax=Bradyrhizobium japonicum TaxID=375 RepID=UPI00200C83A9|nr:hypothetical protein [Bradyrhizobium japonicum]UQD69209.1 hypothetical protein JEY40_24650 [Bradyrhizobium japonicum]WAX24471.1 hypothetical protein [Bradyrhizobium phage ppBjS10J-1]